PPLLTICPQFASHSHALHRDPHPFPTRRSSDLGHGTPCPYTRAINMRDQIVKDAKRLVLKVGSRLVASKGSGLNTERIDRLASEDRKSTRLNSSHEWISYAVFCLKKKKKTERHI